MSAQRPTDFLLSVVLPIYNEEQCASECVRRLQAVMQKNGYRYELIFVNDGSTDNTLAILREARQSDNNIRLLNFSRNFSHQIAISAGLQHVNGDCIVVLDSDLQDPPEFIPKLIEKWQEGFDVVHAQRIKRHGETVFKKVVAATFYRILAEISSVQIPVDVGDFRAMDAKVVRAINQLPERHRYVRGMVCWVGYRHTIIPYERDQRFAGKPKYSLRKLIKLAFEGIVSFSNTPLRVPAYVGIVLLAASALVLGAAIIEFAHDTNRVLLIVIFVTLFVGGIQLICLGMMGEYLGYVYEETKHRPLYYLLDE